MRRTPVAVWRNGMLRSGAHALYKEQADVDELPRAKHSGDERVQQRGLVAPEPVTAGVELSYDRLSPDDGCLERLHQCPVLQCRRRQFLGFHRLIIHRQGRQRSNFRATLQCTLQNS